MNERVLSPLSLFKQNVRYVINEDKIDSITIKCTNGIEVNIKEYIQMIALEVIEGILTETRSDKDDGKI